MEKFYRALPDSRLHADYMEWEDCCEEMREIIDSLFEEYGVEATRYSAGKFGLAIEATPGDLEKFKGQFKKGHIHGIFEFRKNSHICKEWAKRSERIKMRRKPFLSLYFDHASCRMSTRLFQIDGVVYCSIDAGDVAPKDKLVEIKASEFWRVIENYEERFTQTRREPSA